MAVGDRRSPPLMSPPWSMAWPWREIRIPGGYQLGAICRETAGRARSIAATPGVFLVAVGLGTSYKSPIQQQLRSRLANRAVLFALHWSRRSWPMTRAKPSACDGFRAWISVPGRAVFAHWGGVQREPTLNGVVRALVFKMTERVGINDEVHAVALRIDDF